MNTNWLQHLSLFTSTFFHPPPLDLDWCIQSKRAKRYQLSKSLHFNSLQHLMILWCQQLSAPMSSSSSRRQDEQAYKSIWTTLRLYNRVNIKTSVKFSQGEREKSNQKASGTFKFKFHYTQKVRQAFEVVYSSWKSTHSITFFCVVPGVWPMTEINVVPFFKVCVEKFLLVIFHRVTFYALRRQEIYSRKFLWKFHLAAARWLQYEIG